MANRHLWGHKYLEAMEFTGEQAWEAIGECAAWLCCADNFDHDLSIISVTTGWDTENEQWMTTLVYDDTHQHYSRA